MRSALVLLGFPLLVAACAGPLGPIPGGRLSGVVASQTVKDWSFVQDDMITIETRPSSRPYSVTVPCLRVKRYLYLEALDPDLQRWAGYLLDDPEVRLRVAGVVYEVNARRVNHPGEQEALLQQIAYRRGANDPALDLGRSIWFFRVVPRPLAADASAGR